MNEETRDAVLARIKSSIAGQDTDDREDTGTPTRREPDGGLSPGKRAPSDPASLVRHVRQSKPRIGL